MANLVIVGMQWGDEGKGKIVDLLCPAFSSVVRYQGGHNAGHTVKFADRHFSLHLIPSGILHEGMECFLGNGMVVSPPALFEELDGLHEAGIDSEGRLLISDRAQVLLPPHIALDNARESARGEKKIGTTSRGIGPCYEAKAARMGVRTCDLASDELEERLAILVETVSGQLDLLGAKSGDLYDETLDCCRQHRERLLPLLCDVPLRLEQGFAAGKTVLFEGAQGALLDVDHGTYPFVTSSNSIAGGACTGAGVPPQRISGAIGILKAYTTRVGGGPFPTELEGEVGEHLRERGHEFGTSTGRPRRCGWLDLVVARHGRRLNGVESIALTKLDVLDDLAEIQVCTAYRMDGQRVEHLPADTCRLGEVEPVYETLPGWQTNTVGTRSLEELPAEARDYIAFLEREIGAEVGLVSTGPRREETFVAAAPRLREWLGDELAGVESRIG